MTAFFLLYNDASFRTLEAAVEWNGENGGEAVLSYYIPELKNRYDLYGIWNDSFHLESRMSYFVSENSPFWTSSSRGQLLNAELRRCQVDPTGYSLMDPVQIEHQIHGIMEYGLILNFVDDLDWLSRWKEILNYVGQGMELRDDGNQVQRGGNTSGTSYQDKMTQLEHEVNQMEQKGEGTLETITLEDGVVLSDEEVIQRLPSHCVKDSGVNSSWKLLTSGEEGLLSAIRSSLDVDQYALHYFGNYVTKQEGYFRCQLEYILQGETSDEENLRQTKQELFFLRTAMNLVELQRDETKKEAISAMAMAAAPVPYPVAYGLLSAAVSAVDAGEDVKTLMNGGDVSLLQLNGEEQPLKLSYEDHLYVLLFLRSKETKVLRMMDLIQLDLQKRYGNDFSLEELCGGFRWTLEATLRNSLGKESIWSCEGVSAYGR